MFVGCAGPIILLFPGAATAWLLGFSQRWQDPGSVNVVCDLVVLKFWFGLVKRNTYPLVWFARLDRCTGAGRIEWISDI
jgi:hypothetical protein